MIDNSNETNKESLVKKMFDLGAHFGYARESRHPSVKSFLFGLKNKTIIIDLEKTVVSLEQAKDFVLGLGSARKNIVLVGTKKESSDVVKNIGLEFDLPYVAERWIGGTLTNFKEIRGRINRLIDLRDQDAKGELVKYTKKERGLIAKEVANLERYFDSLINLNKLPGAIIVVDPKKEMIAVNEAKILNIPVIALANSDCNIDDIMYPIVANDAQRKVIDFIVRELVETYQTGLKEADKKPAETSVVA